MIVVVDDFCKVKMIVESSFTAHEDTKGHIDGSVTFRTKDKLKKIAILVLHEHLLIKRSYNSVVNLFFFRAKFVLGFTHKKHAFHRRASRPSKHRVVSLFCPCTFSLMLSYTAVANELPSNLLSPISITPNRCPFSRVRARTFLI